MPAWDPADLPRGGGRVRLSVDGSVARLLIDQPQRRNAISPGMMVELREAVATLEAASGCCAVILSGAGGAFCSGGDLSAVRAHLLQPGAGAGMCAYMTDTLDRLAALPMVCIAAVEGSALGGGAELLTVADVAVAGQSARIGFVHASLGVSTGWGGGRRLVAQVGPRKALRLLAFAERLSSAEAREAGLIDQVVEDGGALEAAEALAARLAALPVEAVRAAVTVARGGDEAGLFAALWGGPAHQAALQKVRAGRRR